MATVFSDTGAGRAVSGQCNGPWSNSKGKGRYLGLKFLIEGKVHFGWARLTVSCRGTDVLATLTGYAYETVPNKAIIAGKTKGPTDLSADAESLNRIPVTARPASLGVLTLGAQGVALGRRRELAAEGE